MDFLALRLGMDQRDLFEPARDVYVIVPVLLQGPLCCKASVFGPAANTKLANLV